MSNTTEIHLDAPWLGFWLMIGLFALGVGLSPANETPTLYHCPPAQDLK